MSILYFSKRSHFKESNRILFTGFQSLDALNINWKKQNNVFVWENLLESEQICFLKIKNFLSKPQKQSKKTVVFVRKNFLFFALLSETFSKGKKTFAFYGFEFFSIFFVSCKLFLKRNSCILFWVVLMYCYGSFKHCIPIYAVFRSH